MYVNDNNVTYSDSFEIEHIAKEIKKITGIKNITNTYRIQSYTSIMCDTFVLDLSIWFEKEKVDWNIQIYFLLMIMKRMIKSW